MDGPDTANVLWYLLVLLMVGSALLSRRIPWRSAAGMVLAWVGIFAVVMTGVSYRREIGIVFDRVSRDVTGRTMQSVDGDRLRVPMAEDGHYWVEGTINGVAARFLIDSGATVTALSSETARAAAVDIDRQRMPVVMETANGPVEAQRASVDVLAIGSIRVTDFPVVVAPQFGKINVIGMNLLSRLKSWRVENGEMVLEP